MIPKITYKVIESRIIEPVEQQKYDIAIYDKKMAEYVFKHNIKERVFAIDEDKNRMSVCNNMAEVDEFYNNSTVKS